MGIPPDGAGGGGRGLGGTEGRATGGEWSTKKGIGRVGAERAGVTVIDWSMDWNVSFASCTWSILRAAAYQASRSVLADCPKGMVAIWLWTFNLSPRWNLTTKVRGSVYLASEARIRKLSK